MRLVKQLSRANRNSLRHAAIETLESRQLLSGSTPFFANPFGINQLVPAADYDKGGEGVAFHAVTATDMGNAPTYRPGDAISVSTGGSTGHVVSFTGVGEYLNYSLKIPTAGSYFVGFLGSNTAAGASLHITFNGKNLTGEYNVPNTGSFNVYKSTFSSAVNLPAGNVLMQVTIDQVASNGSGGNLDAFAVVTTTAPKTVAEHPYGSTAFTTGQTIPMAQYDFGGEGVSFHSVTGANYGTSPFRQPDAISVSYGGTTGNILGHTGAGEWLNYTINVPTAGQYQLVTSVANPVGGALFHASENGTNLTGPISTTATADFNTYANNTSLPFTLAAGTQVIQIKFDKAASNGAVGNFDTMKLVPYTPAPETPFTTAFGTNQIIPAANYDNGGQNVAYHTTVSTNQGNDNYRSPDPVGISTGGVTGHVITHTTPTEYLRYSINVATAGSYVLQASAANTAAGGIFHAMIGSTNITGPIAVAPTSGFFTFAIDQSKAFQLAAGPQVLQIVFDTKASNGAIGNFDLFKLVPSSAPVEAPFTTAFSTNQVIPAVNYNKGGQGVAYSTNLTSNPGNSTYRPGDAVGMKTGGTSGNVLAYTAAGNYFDYTINVATAGNYTLQASTANSASGATFHMSIGGTSLTGPIAIVPTSGFTVFGTDTSASFKLAAGTQVMRITFDTAASNGAVGNFDFFKLVPASGGTTTEKPYTTAFTVNQLIPAVNYNLGGQGVAYSTKLTKNPNADTYRAGDAVGIEPGGASVGHVVAYTAAGNYFDYTINVATAGNYKLQASVANPASGGAFHMSENGTTLGGSIAITQTAGYQVYTTDTSASFHLSAGTQTIRIYFETAASNGAVGNFDWFKIVSA